MLSVLIFLAIIYLSFEVVLPLLGVIAILLEIGKGR